MRFDPGATSHEFARPLPMKRAPPQAEGAAVLFLHGIGGAAKVWDPQIASFTRAGYRPIAIDLPGYGARPPVETMDFEELAADIEDSVAQLELDRPVLVGHSFGGMIAQTTLRRRPDGYQALILVATSPAFGDPTGDLQRRFVAARLGLLDAGKAMPELAEEIIAGIMGPAPDTEGRALAVQAMQRMAAKIPGAHYVCLPGVGHLPNLEAPRVFDAAILDFLRDAACRDRAEMKRNA